MTCCIGTVIKVWRRANECTSEGRTEVGMIGNGVDIMVGNVRDDLEDGADVDDEGALEELIGMDLDFITGKKGRKGII